MMFRGRRFGYFKQPDELYPLNVRASSPSARDVSPRRRRAGETPRTNAEAEQKRLSRQHELISSRSKSQGHFFSGRLSPLIIHTKHSSGASVRAVSGGIKYSWRATEHRNRDKAKLTRCKRLITAQPRSLARSLARAGARATLPTMTIGAISFVWPPKGNPRYIIDYPRRGRINDRQNRTRLRNPGGSRRNGETAPHRPGSQGCVGAGREGPRHGATEPNKTEREREREREFVERSETLDPTRRSNRPFGFDSVRL